MVRAARVFRKSPQTAKTCAEAKNSLIRANRHPVVVYLVAAAIYVALGVALPELLLSWVVGVAYVLLAVWVVPGLLRRSG